MITRFRVEGKGKDKAELAEELILTVSRVIRVVGADREWECTDDVISGDEKRGYSGRMVLRSEIRRNDD
jgi:hypothetical protein